MATLGGTAIPVSVQTGGQQQGGPAIPVAVVSDGRATQGGPAQPVYVVTSGPMQGGPALPVVVATGAQASQILAGPAIPVYVVSGSGLGGTAPANTALPVISGTLVIGQVLTTTDGTWTGTAPIVYTYQWQRNGVDIGGETSNTYTLTASDPGTTITVEVTATNAIGSASATSAGVMPSSLLTGLLAYWKMEEASGNRADATGNGNTLSDNNTVTQAVGKIGNAADCVFANTEYLSINTALTVNGQSRTVAMWVFPTNVAAQRPIGSAGATFQSGSPLWIIVMKSGGGVPWAVFHGGAYRNGTIGVLVNTWYHIVYTFDAGTNNVGLYINGVRDVNVNVADTNSGANTYLGAGFNQNYGGRIDEAGIWNRALSQADVTTLYNAGNGITFPF